MLRFLRQATIVPAVAMAAALIAGNAEASCDDRPSLPEPLSIDSTVNSIKIRWTPNGDARFYDLSIKQKSNGAVIASITGGLENQRRFDANNLASNEDFEVWFTPRTEAGTEGCIAQHPILVVVRTEQAPPPNTGTGSGSGGTGGSAAACAGLAGEELAICEGHNFWRAKHGVPPLTWSAELATNAQNWVNGCHTSKNDNGDDFFCHQSTGFGCGTDPNYHYGENLSFGYPTRSGKEAVDGWYCEINVYDFNNPAVKGGVMFGCNNNPDKVTGHFTQVVWRESTRLGCARNTCSLGGNRGTLWACEYDPPGNFNADQPGVLARNVPKPVQGLAMLALQPENSHTPQQTTAIISDVDLYDIPGGVGRVIGVLRQGQQFPLIGCLADDWCQLSVGWVWGSFIVRDHSH